MAERSNENFDELHKRLELLIQRQNAFSREIVQIRTDLENLRKSSKEATESQKRPVSQLETPKAEQPLPTLPKEEKPSPEKILNSEKTSHKIEKQIPIPKSQRLSGKSESPKQNLEKLIGENLLNKVGIIITVIGVGIGAKYSIENDLISPLTRILLGYLVGIGLLGFGIRLKKNYHNYSAVLVSGAIASLYFITFAAYSFYGLIPQIVAFILMASITAFGVLAALHYNKQIIAHLGLVGAYAVPFLLSNESGQAAVLFGYMTIINVGILLIARKRYWKPLTYSAFLLSVMIFTVWYNTEFDASEHYTLAFVFLTIFFGIFYAMFLSYKLINKGKFRVDDVFLLIANALFFYAIGYSLLSLNETGEQLLGLFTVVNAVIHFIASSIIYRQKNYDQNLLYLIAGMVLIFVTIAIPVQLDGNWVTLLWLAQGTLLFWLGRTKKTPLYEYLAYPILFVATLSLADDWYRSYLNYPSRYSESAWESIRPLLNIHFLTSVLFVTSFGFMNWGLHNPKYAIPNEKKESTFVLRVVGLATVFFVSLYFAIRLEVFRFWQERFLNSKIVLNGDNFEGFGGDVFYNEDFLLFQAIWILNFTLIFFSAMAFANMKKIKNLNLAFITIGCMFLAILIFLIQGLYVLSELRESYILQSYMPYFSSGGFNIGIRYISLGIFASALYTLYSLWRSDLLKRQLQSAFELLLFACILWVVSSELIHWLDLAKIDGVYALGLSILWGVYALGVVAIGIWKRKKHLRIGAMVVFGITLLKLFLYDISELSTIKKTIIFLALGVLLLIISFLYNKFKNNIADAKPPQT